MKRKNLEPTNPIVTARILKRIEQMTPEQALAFLTYRRPGVEETDMTGMFSKRSEATRTVRAKRRPASA
jgi:hypothetical protein